MPRIRESACSGSGEGPILAASFLLCPHWAEGSWEPCGVFFIKMLYKALWGLFHNAIQEGSTLIT